MQNINPSPHSTQRSKRVPWDPALKRTKMILCGNYGAGNLGDEATLQALVLELGEQFDLTVMSANPVETTERVGVKAVAFLPSGFRSWTRAILSREGRAAHLKTQRAIEETEVFVLGGGTLLTDEPWRSLWIWRKQIKKALDTKKRIWIYRAGIGPLKHSASQKWVSHLLKQSERVVVRDPLSKEWCQRLGRDAVESSMDAVLNGQLKFPKHKGLNSGAIIFSPRYWIKNMNNKQRAFSEFIRYLCLNEGRKVIGIPFESGSGNEVDLMNKIFEQSGVGDAAHVETSFTQPEQVYEAIASAEMMIGMRLHSLIFAEAIGTPFLAINYAEKNRGFLQSVHKEKAGIPLEEVTVKNLIRLYKEVSKSEA